MPPDEDIFAAATDGYSGSGRASAREPQAEGVGRGQSNKDLQIRAGECCFIGALPVLNGPLWHVSMQTSS